MDGNYIYYSKNTGTKNSFSGTFYLVLPISLKKLVAYECNITKIELLNDAPNLESVNLSYNPISTYSFLEKAPNINWLRLCGNQISDARFLEKLTNLNSLDISSNKISDASFLEKLTGLTTLYLSYNQISDASFLEKLTGLTTLYLSYNQISDASFLEKLTGLTTLYLSYNQISDASFLEKLTGLTTLYLSSNQISDASFLEKLTGLTTLYLSSNQISDASFLEKLTGLTTLYLSSNQISDWRFLEKLTGLTTLDLSSNQISDASFLEKLTGLTTLDLSNNQISDASFLEKLTGLTTLDLSYNQISDLEPLLTLIKKGVPVTLEKYGDGINLHENPLINPPITIVEQGNPAILEYFRQKEKAGIKPLLEAKMVLLGEGRAGKTSLACRMLGKELPKQEDRTQGVDIVIGEYRFPVEEGEFVLHIWDFAGQDKYKPLHQFFYTEGAVYVMVADSGNAQTDFADWFETTEMFGGEGSPLLVALNEFREGMGIGAFDEEKWRKQFPKLIKEVRLVNLLSQNGFPALEKDIRHLANQLPHTRTEYPANWANIRSELERRRDENYISLKEYLDICKQFDLPEREGALILSGILHRIGVCLHYQKSELLRLHVILKNEWATAAVYKILEDQTVAEVKKGFFDWSDLRRIWSDDSYQDMQPQLLELMCEFKMAYPLPNGKEFVTPPLLPSTSPHDWDFPVGEAIEVRVEYEFLPKALMTQFIVSRHTDIDRGRTLVWREGVVLRWSADTLAQVSKIKSRGRDALQIQALGSERRGLLTAILKTLRDLHEEYRGIRAHEIVPCPCEGCRTEKNPQHYFDFKNLSNRLEKGRRVVECDQSLEEVDLLKILGDLLLFERLGVGEAVVLKDMDQQKPATETQSNVPLAFFSYSKEDVAYLQEFQKHLKTLERQGLIRFWDDRKIRPGEEWDDEIKKALSHSDIVFLLVSVDFLATDYIWKTEITEAMLRHKAGKARVIPIKIRPCDWVGTPFAKLQGLPRKDKIIGSNPQNDELWTEVVKEIKELIE
ncbi:leucine-rich repeat domain-containing protein [Haliscomenobacter sp.]|uniref:leucine-rich repeat domain-containing protein n=1 Tax=Haliscomenobacter sp. TaxID=2717303 RepID=UPI003BAAB4B7